jgi:hypothetical protein
MARAAELHRCQAAVQAITGRPVGRHWTGKVVWLDR